MRKIILRACGLAVGEPPSASFDIAGDFRKRRTAIGAGEFQSVVSGGVVAGGDVDGAVQFAAQDFEGDCGRRSGPIAKKDVAAFGLKDGSRGARELLGKKAGIIADEERRIFVLSADVFGDGGGGDAHAVEGKVVGDNAAPAGGSEMNRGSSHAGVYCIVTCGMTYQGNSGMRGGRFEYAGVL